MADHLLAIVKLFFSLTAFFNYFSSIHLFLRNSALIPFFKNQSFKYGFVCVCVCVCVNIKIYLAASGPHWGSWDLCYIVWYLSLWCMDSLVMVLLASSIVAAWGLGCPEPCGIIVPKQGLNPHPLHCKANFTDHQGSTQTLNIWYPVN